MSRLICGEGTFFSLDSFETQLSNNVLVIGSTGSGKTRSFIQPNIEQLFGSSLIYDPKGSLYKKYAAWLREQGYHVGKLDFSNTRDSLHYNPFAYIRTTQDVSKVAYALVHEDKESRMDPFWEEASRLLLQSIIAYLLASRPEHAHNMSSVMYVLEKMCGQSGDLDESNTPLDQLFAGMRNRDSEMGQYAQRCYRQFRVAASKTLRSIIITTFAKLVPFTSAEMEELTFRDDVNITMLGQRKTALFVVCSDSEGGHLDRVLRLFFTQMLQELSYYADNYCDGMLKVPVRLILDDFACGVSLAGFDRSISIIRSRGISVMIVLQSLSQLTDLYGGSAAKTIVNNCDTILYMGCNDVETAHEISLRTNLPLRKILYQPIGQSWVFRRGQEPRLVKNISPETSLVPEAVHGAKHTQKVTEMYISA